MKKTMIVLTTCISVVLFASQANASQYDVSNCSWATTSGYPSGQGYTTHQAYNCTLDDSGATVTPLNRTISATSTGTSCNISATNPYGYSGTCWQPTLVVPADPGSCGANAGQFYDEVTVQYFYGQALEDALEFCGDCGINATPGSVASGPYKSLYIWCKD